MSKYKPNLKLPHTASAPDNFEPINNYYPDDDFVVSRGDDGLPLSHFGQLIWNLSPYNLDGKTLCLYFNFWVTEIPSKLQLELSLQMRIVIHALIWKRDGSSLSVQTVQNYVSVLTGLAIYCDSQSKDFGLLLNCEKSIEGFLACCSGWMAETFSSLLPHLAKLGVSGVGFSVVNDKVIFSIKKKNSAYRKSLKQHAPIPTRIYSHFISAVESGLAKWEEVSADILKAAAYCGSEPRAGRSLEWQENLTRELNLKQEIFTPFYDLITEKSRDYILSQGKDIEVSSLSSILGSIQYYANLLIQIFSGMRDKEVSSLPFHCTKKVFWSGKTYFLILGRTTKFNKGKPIRAHWVTNKEGFWAILIAQKIASVIYELFGTKPQPPEKTQNKTPLFVSVSYLGLVGIRKVPVANKYESGEMGHRSPPPGSLLKIETEDLLELEHIDPHRAWRDEEKYKIGAEWHFTSHQLRRSLALYAQRSGLVSLPSLRRQLKHITDGMARYYAKGFEFAEDIVGGEKTHFALEWRSAIVESAALKYIQLSAQIVKREISTFGAHADWIRHRVAGADGGVLVDRDVTMKKFKSGQLNYRETVLGGCVNSGTCEKVAIQLLHTACIRDNCKNLIGSPAALDRIISSQTIFLTKLDKTSIEFRTESSELKLLETFRATLRK